MITATHCPRSRTFAALQFVSGGAIGALIVALAVNITGCAGSKPAALGGRGEGIARNSRLRFQVQANATIRSESSGVDIIIGLANDALVFAREGERYHADFEVFVRGTDPAGERIPADTVVAFTRSVKTYEETQVWDPDYLRIFIPFSPGEYDLSVGVRDLVSGKAASWTRELLLPDTAWGKARLLNVTLSARDRRGETVPILLSQLASDYDSAKATANVIVPSLNIPVDIWFSMIKYPADTSIATPLDAPSFRFQTELESRGVEYSRPDTILNLRKTVRGREHIETEQFEIGAIPEGVFRLSIGLSLPQSGDVEPAEVYRRDLAVFPPGFPKIVSRAGLLQTLVYIATQNERDSLLADGSADAIRRRFEAFWLGRFSPQQARDKIKLYSQRVVEANTDFTTYKEGWRTDRGMIFIVLGPPSRIEHWADQETWYYPDSGNELGGAYTFVAAKWELFGTPWQVFTLRANPVNVRYWTNALQVWR